MDEIERSISDLKSDDLLTVYYAADALIQIGRWRGGIRTWQRSTCERPSSSL